MTVRSQPPGLQAERTRLAWRRTTLGTATVALLGVGRVVAAGGRPAAVVAIALTGLALLGILWLAHRRVRTLAAPLPAAASGAPAALALLVAAIALVGTMLVD
jgi:hypothetical protein